MATPDSGVRPEDGSETHAHMVEFRFALTWTVGGRTWAVDEGGRKEVHGLLRLPYTLPLPLTIAVNLPLPLPLPHTPYPIPHTPYPYP